MTITKKTQVDQSIKYLEEFQSLVEESGICPQPTGFYLLVRVIDVEEKSAGGIVLGTNNELSREQAGYDIGVVIGFGSQCYKGFDCVSPEQWGVKVGNHIEFRRYDGKPLRYEQFENYRNLTDSDVHLVYKNIGEQQ